MTSNYTSTDDLKNLFQWPDYTVFILMLFVSAGESTKFFISYSMIIENIIDTYEKNTIEYT